jgi:hypothetical protein
MYSLTHTRISQSVFSHINLFFKIFDKFNLCLTDSNSKVNYKALNTMFQITPILIDGLSPVVQNVIPLLAQNLASKNNEIQDIASNILDLFVEYLGTVHVLFLYASVFFTDYLFSRRWNSDTAFFKLSSTWQCQNTPSDYKQASW